MKKLAMGALVLALSCSPILAGPLNTEQIAGKAKWLAHVDVAALLKSGIAQFVLAEAEKKDGFLEGIVQFRETVGFDPLKDVHGLTIYGMKVGDESGVVILDATTDKDKLLTLLTANETYKSHEYGDYVLHQWTDEAKMPKVAAAAVKMPKTHYGTFYDAKTIVVASSLALLKDAIDVLDGKGESLAKSEGIKVLPKTAAGAFAVAAAEGIELPANAKPEAALLRDIRDASVQIGETEGSTFLAITAWTQTAEKALKLRQVVQGFVALGQMMMAEQPDLPVLGEKVQVTGEETTVHVDAAVPTESLIKMIQFAAERKKQMEARKDRLKAAAAGAKTE